MISEMKGDGSNTFVTQRSPRPCQSPECPRDFRQRLRGTRPSLCWGMSSGRAGSGEMTQKREKANCGSPGMASRIATSTTRVRRAKDELGTRRSPLELLFGLVLPACHREGDQLGDTSPDLG